MKIGIIGAGIAGLSAAWHLGGGHDIKVFEARRRAGGHADTEFIGVGGKNLAVDTGFIVFNRKNYPVFAAMLDDLGVVSQDSSMSFGVQHLGNGLVYNATSLNRLFVQRHNLVRPRFWRMLADLLRFYRKAPSQIRQNDAAQALGSFLEQFAYSEAFATDHLLPMVGALWSMSLQEARQFPVGFLVGFMASHGMLNLGRRPQWRTVEGGSIRYVEALIERMDMDLALNSPVQEVQRGSRGVKITTKDGRMEVFDRVVMACHGDTALKLLDKPSDAEMSVLGNICFQDNDITLHTDTAVLPRQTAARASWNVRVPAEGVRDGLIHVTYLMNLLQNLDTEIPVMVSLNQDQEIDADKVISRKVYRHPVYRLDTWQAMQSRTRISGKDRIHYCGAYWGWGFHESGAETGLAVAEEIKREALALAA